MKKIILIFYLRTHNTVHAITFGKEINNNNIEYQNIDGNNRINAIQHYISKPFEIFPEYMNEIVEFINENIKNDDENKEAKNIFYNISYSDFINFNYKNYFKNNNYNELYEKTLKSLRDDFEEIIKTVQNKLKINKQKSFAGHIKINVNIFEGYSIQELCNTFESINKYNGQLTTLELLSCKLFNKTNFVIENNTIKSHIYNKLKKYYKNKSEGEILDCYKFDENTQINAYDLIVGFQLYCSEKCKIVNNSEDDFTIFFKLFNIYNNGVNDRDFNTQNVNNL